MHSKHWTLPLCQILVEIRSVEEHGYILNDCKLMCVLHNDFKIQNGKWLSSGKHRWDVVKAHRRESRKGKEPTISAFKKINRRYEEKYNMWKIFIILKFQEKMLTEKITLPCPMWKLWATNLSLWAELLCFYRLSPINVIMKFKISSFNW